MCGGTVVGHVLNSFTGGLVGRDKRDRSVVDPAVQAQIQAEQAANDRQAQVLIRRRRSSLLLAGNTVLGASGTTGGSAAIGSPAGIPGSGGGSVLGAGAGARLGGTSAGGGR